jgi:dihydrofolate reductase
MGREGPGDAQADLLRDQFDWGAPDEEVHTFINDLNRPVGTYLYGRKMYEVMVAWEKLNFADEPPYMQDFAQIWQAADKIVYSKTLEAVSTARTRLERDFDPEAIKHMKASASSDLTVSGPNLAAHAFKAGVVDECQLFLAPVVVGGGNQSLPDQCPPESRTDGPTSFRQRHGVPPLPEQDVTTRAHGLQS